MIVISDNSALSALAEAGLIDFLPRLFGSVVIPDSVRREACHPGAPAALRTWIAKSPIWLRVVEDPKHRLPETEGLDSGEASAITLAWEDRAKTRLILDEKRGRAIARSLGLKITGTVGIVGEFAKEGFVDFDEAMALVKGTGFHVSDAVIETVRHELDLS